MFWKDKTRLDGYSCWCKECKTKSQKANRERRVKLRQVNREVKKEYLLNAKTACLKCGEDRPYVIQFHHIVPATKSIKHSVRNYSLEKIEQELDKCVCLCANCHIEFHHLYGSNPDKPREALEEYLGKQL